MKKIIISAAMALFTLSAFAFESEVFTPKGNFSSYTKTEFAVTSKFGDYFRSVNVKNVYVFDSTGLVTSNSAYNAKDELISKIDYTYDISRNLTATTYTDVSGAVIWKSKVEYQSDGKVKAETEYDSAENITAKTIYKYDASKMTTSYYDGQGKLLSRNISILNENEKPVETFQYYSDGSLALRQVFTYLDNGKISYVEEYNDGNQISGKTVYKYDTNSAVSEIQKFSAKGILIQRSIYKNDAKGNPTRINIYDVAEKFGSTANELLSITEFAYKN